jgi:hypothetical protein
VSTAPAKDDGPIKKGEPTLVSETTPTSGAPDKASPLSTPGTTVGAPDKTIEPGKPGALADAPDASKTTEVPTGPKGRFVSSASGAAAAAGAAGAAAGSTGSTDKDTPSSPDDGGPQSKEEERDNLGPPPVAVRHRRVSGRLVIVLVVILLVIGALGGWYYKRHHSTTPHRAAPTQQAIVADAALAGRIGIQAADLPGWTSAPTTTGNAFASDATTSAASTAAFTKASDTLATCLKVPTPDVTRAFGAASPNRTAFSSSPTYIAPVALGAGTAANSVVDVMRSPKSEHSDNKVFTNPTLFVSCYKIYAQAMLPYAIPAAAAAVSPFTSVSVVPATVAAPTNSRVHAQAFVITRSRATGAPVVTTAVAIFGGRLQATLDLSSPGAFPATSQSALVGAVETRVAGDLPATKTTK